MSFAFHAIIFSITTLCFSVWTQALCFHWIWKGRHSGVIRTLLFSFSVPFILTVKKNQTSGLQSLGGCLGWEKQQGSNTLNVAKDEIANFYVPWVPCINLLITAFTFEPSVSYVRSSNLCFFLFWEQFSESLIFSGQASISLIRHWLDFSSPWHLFSTLPIWFLDSITWLFTYCI